MDISSYFEHVALDKPDENLLISNDIFGKSITINTPNIDIGDISNYQIAIIGIPEDRESNNKGTASAPDKIRSCIYQLFKTSIDQKIIDLGNLKIGTSINDTYFGLRDVLLELLANHVISIIIGGSQDLTFSCFQAFEKIKDRINFISIDSTIDLKNSNIFSEKYLSKILINNKLFNFTNVGHQQYLTEPGAEKYLNERKLNSIRLGNVRSNIKLVEPVIRDADFVSFDIGSVKQSDAPGKKYTSPNGFLADEACQIARYAGISDKVTLFGIFEVNPLFDINNHTSSLASQIIWNFIEGIKHRKQEYPNSNDQNYKSFVVKHHDMKHEVVFYRSLSTDRWWMEVPILSSGKKIFISCNFEDYQQACKHDVPESWWEAFQKLNYEED